MLGDFFNFSAAERERKVLTFGPQRQQVAVVRAAGLAGLAGDAGGQAAVPVGQVEHLPIRRAVDLPELVVVPGVVRRVDIAAARHRTEVERRGVGRAESWPADARTSTVCSLPQAPVRRIVAEQLSWCRCDGRGEGRCAPARRAWRSGSGPKTASSGWFNCSSSSVTLRRSPRSVRASARQAVGIEGASVSSCSQTAYSGPA